MHIFLYEWVTGGGLVEETGALPPTLLTEGAAMLTALAADFLTIDGCRVSTLRDIRIDHIALPGCEITEVHSASHHADQISRLSAEAVYTLIIAPEFDDILLETHKLAVASGGNILGCPAEFLSIAADKNRTAQQCVASGILVPQAVTLNPDSEKLPKGFDYPAVLKPVVGAGSQNTFLVTSSLDEPPPYPWPRRLEKYCPGTPASVSFLCGPNHRVPLAACRQRLSTDDRLTYLGGSLLLEEDLAMRATQLADRVLEALPEALGYVGVDLILGKAADGSKDFFLEVNPRLTTSYVGLRAATDENLAAAMLANFSGEVCRPTFRLEPLEFSADGSVRQPTR